MIDLGGFPGVIEGDELCHGIRWRIGDTAIMSAMDAFEDVTNDPVTSLYLRKRISLVDDTGAESGETAWIYWYNRPADGFPSVVDGNWPLDAGKTRK